MGVCQGKHYYEAVVTDEGLCRVGWSTGRATLELGEGEGDVRGVAWVWLFLRKGQMGFRVWRDRQEIQCQSV